MKKDKQISFRVSFIFNDIKQAVKVRILLNKYEFKVSSLVNRNEITFEHREKRLKKILNYLEEKICFVSMTTLYMYFSRHLSISYRTLQRDITILIMQNKINVKYVNNKISNGRATLIKLKKEKQKKKEGDINAKSKLGELSQMGN